MHELRLKSGKSKRVFGLIPNDYDILHKTQNCAREQSMGNFWTKEFHYSPINFGIGTLKLPKKLEERIMTKWYKVFMKLLHEFV
jgi:hypothetical protein